MKNFSLVSCKNLDEWREIYTKSEESNVFIRPELLDAMDLEYDFWFAYSGDEKIAAIPVLKSNGEPISIQPTFLKYYGLMFFPVRNNMSQHKRAKWTPDITLQILNELSKKYYKLLFQCSYMLDDLRGFQWFNYHAPQYGKFNITLEYTSVINLYEINNIDEYISNLKDPEQNDFQNRLSFEYAVSENPDSEIIDNILQLAFLHADIVRNKSEEILLRNIIDVALKKKFGHMYVLLNNNNDPISGVFILYDNFTAYYLFGVNATELDNESAEKLLLLEVLKKCWEKQFKRFDFCGVDTQNKNSLATSFDADIRSYFTTKWKNEIQFNQ